MGAATMLGFEADYFADQNEEARHLPTTAANDGHHDIAEGQVAFTICPRTSSQGRRVHPVQGTHSKAGGSTVCSPGGSCFHTAGAGNAKKIDHKNSLKDELDSAWAVRPLSRSQRDGLELSSSFEHKIKALKISKSQFKVQLKRSAESPNSPNSPKIASSPSPRVLFRSYFQQIASGARFAPAAYAWREAGSRRLGAEE
jgi:hypothetical protein